ncbi:helix-turn-helix domain-containing protein, partial [Shigella sonnei]|uniref:helix-turn-helix domain-containing protein n=1 Tax=Shigella sonnei TaxID=624 RepID=UPI0020938EA7
ASVPFIWSKSGVEETSVLWCFFNLFGVLIPIDERNLTRERTQVGLQAARARGRKGGRPKTLSKDKQALAVQLYNEKKHTVAQICVLMGISRPTLYKYIESARLFKK